MNTNQQYTATFSINGQQAKDEIKRITDNIKKLDDAMLKLDKSTNEGKEAFKKMHEEQEKNKQDLRQMQSMSKALKSAMTDLDKASPRQLRQTMRDINKAIDSGAIKRGTKDWKEALKVLSKCDNELKKINAEQKAFGNSKGIGSFMSGGAKGVTSILGKFGLILSAVGALAKVFGDLYSKTKEFEQANANLASVLGTTRDNIKDLTDQAKMLGSTTMYTATQVSQLQTELAKLGFSNSEIKNSTSAILDFAAATGAELPEAASVAGAALRAFGLDASDMDRVVSTLAVSTTKSALDFGKLQTSLSIVAPVARQFGFSIEETTALLGKLSDAGFDASSAATATRNIMLYMADSSSKLSKALGRPIKSLDDLGPAFKALTDKGMDLAQMLEVTDKRAVAAFATLVSSGDGLVKLKNEITDCSDALGTMVDERMDTLEGSTIRLSSAWDGLMLSFSNSTGPLKTVVDWITSLVNGMTWLFSTLEEDQEREIFENVTLNTKEQAQAWKDIASTLDNTNIDERIKEYADGLSYAREEANTAREQINILNKAWKLGLGTKAGQELTGGLNHEQWKARLESLKQDVINYETEAKKYEYLYQKGLSFKASISGSGQGKQSDPKMIKIAKYDNKAAADILSVKQDSTLTEEEKADKIYAINKALFEAKRDLYDQDEKEYLMYNRKVLEIEAKHQDELLKRQKKREQAEKKEKSFQDKIASGDKSYESALSKLTAAELKYQGIVSGDESWRNRQKKALNALAVQKAGLDETYKLALDNLKKMEDAEIEHGEDKEEIEKKYQEKRLELKKRYDAAVMANDNATNATIEANTKETFRKTADAITEAMNQVASVMTHISDLIQANYELQLTSLEKKYDAEISAAEKAGKDTTKFEEKKAKETARIERRQASAQFKADIAQSMIDSALASVKVWADPGWPMAIPLQAIITANQGMTIATLSKQYQTKLASIGQYYDGGYTGDGRKYHRVAGVVHDGEFVANHNSVNNPEVRPVLDAINYAQQTNTASSMTRSDLAAAIGYERGGYTSPVDGASYDNGMMEKLTRVLTRIDREGIEAHTYVNGRGGINNAQAKYTRLYNNAHR